MPVDPIKVTLEAPGIKRLNQKCYKLFSNVPLKIDLRRYSMAGAYVRTPPGPRAARVRGALCAVGPSVVSGACTTVGAALFLLGCTAGSSTPPLIYSNGSTVFFTETTQREPCLSLKPPNESQFHQIAPNEFHKRWLRRAGDWTSVSPWCTVTFFTKFGVFISWTLSMSLLQAIVVGRCRLILSIPMLKAPMDLSLEIVIS